LPLHLTGDSFLVLLLVILLHISRRELSCCCLYRACLCIFSDPGSGLSLLPTALFLHPAYPPTKGPKSFQLILELLHLFSILLFLLLISISTSQLASFHQLYPYSTFELATIHTISSTPPNLDTLFSPVSMASSSKPPVDTSSTEHNQWRKEVEATLEAVKQVFSRSLSPVPTLRYTPRDDDTQTKTGLLSDVRKLGFEDVETLLSLFNSERKGVQNDDKFLLENLVGVLSKQIGRAHV